MLISVIVPVYKVEQYLTRCVDSILNQTFTDFELILVDDGSLDNCGRICDEYARKDERVHVIHKANGGLSDARNAGIDWCFANSNSEWITFIDSDDWIHPRYLDALYKSASKYNLSVSVCGYAYTEEITPFDDIKEIKMDYLDVDYFYLNYPVSHIVAWGKLYRKDCFDNIRFPLGKIHEDEYIIYKLLFKNEKIVFVDHSLYFYYKNSEGIMNSKWSLRRLDVIDAIREQCEYFKDTKYREVYLFTVEKFVCILRSQYENLILFDDFKNKNKYIRMIRRELRNALRRIKRPLKYNDKFYPIAYPRLIKLFYFNKRLKKKIKRMIKSEN